MRKLRYWAGEVQMIKTANTLHHFHVAKGEIS